MKVVINSKVGGFDLSFAAVKLFTKKKGYILQEFPNEIEWRTYYTIDNVVFEVSEIKRDDPTLVEVVEELGEDANTRYSWLKVVEIPDGIDFTIIASDSGSEFVCDVNHMWS